jgi:hypothetical protein
VDRLFGASYWDRQIEEEIPYFQIDYDERNRVNKNKGVFQNPKIFFVIESILTRGKKSKYTINELQNEIAYNYIIEHVPRSYEELQLCTPNDRERPCVNGFGCLCYQWFKFVMKEFVTPLEQAEMKKTNVVDSTGKFCLLCLRRSIEFLQSLYIIADLKNPENYITQTHRNLVNQVGEYTIECSLPMENGIIYPVVMNMKLGYSYHEQGNKKWLTQDGYRVCTQKDIDEQNFRTGILRQKNHASERAGFEQTSL